MGSLERLLESPEHEPLQGFDELPITPDCGWRQYPESVATKARSQNKLALEGRLRVASALAVPFERSKLLQSTWKPQVSQSKMPAQRERDSYGPDYL